MAFERDQVNDAFLNQLIDNVYSIDHMNFDQITGYRETNGIADELAKYSENEVTPRFAKRKCPVFRGDENGLLRQQRAGIHIM